MMLYLALKRSVTLNREVTSKARRKHHSLTGDWERERQRTRKKERERDRRLVEGERGRERETDRPQ